MNKRVDRRQLRIKKAAERAVAPLREEARTLVAAGRAEDAVEALLHTVEELATRLASIEIPPPRKAERSRVREAAAAVGGESEESAESPPETDATIHDPAAEAELPEGSVAPDDAGDARTAEAEVEAAQAAQDQAIADELRAREEAENASRPQRSRPGRKALPPELPRERVVVPVPEGERCCPDCGADRVVIGHEDSEVLEIEPLRFKVVRYEREKMACKQCGDSGVVTAPPGDKVWERSLAGPGLLSQIGVSKFEDHVPLSRFRTMCCRMGVDIAESTLGGWMARIAEDLQPLADASWKELLESFVIQTDASGIPVLDREHEDGITRGTMWCYVGDRRVVSFRYTETGVAKEGPWSALAGRTGYIQADAANVFDALYDGRQAQGTEVACWAHARRRFWKLKDSDPRAMRGVELIGKLYRIEDLGDARGLSAEQRTVLRRESSVPVLGRIKDWLDKTERRENPKSDLAQATRYALRQWTALNRFTEDGRLDLDNNLCELQIRSLAVGRRVWLFAGSHDAARRSATMYGLLRTCALHGVQPDTWLQDVLTKLARGWPASRIHELLPQHWRPEEAQQAEPVQID